MNPRSMACSSPSVEPLMIKAVNAAGSLSVRAWAKDAEMCRRSLLMESLAAAVAGILMNQTGTVDGVVIEWKVKT